MRSRSVSVVLGMVCVLGATGAPTVFAQPKEQSTTSEKSKDAAVAKAQAAFDQAQQDYLAKKWDEAAANFEAAYAARDFPQFLFNIAACYHMKGKSSSDPVAYEKAIGFYKQYLAKDANAPDKAKVEKAIAVLEEEIKLLRAKPAPAPDAQAAPVAPSPAVEQLGAVQVRGLFVIESEPAGATIYLDNRKNGPFAVTPWSGSLEGEHKIILEKRGAIGIEKDVIADPSRIYVLSAALGKEQFLGWVDFTSNIPKSEVFIDNQEQGSVGRTPYSQYVKPGKHTFWITTEGYDTHKEELEVIAGGTHEVKAQLKGTPVGKINVIGLGIEDSTVYVDGKVACERGPCLKALGEGEHTVTVTREGMKPYSRRIRIQAKTETNVKVTLAPKPSRSDAVIAYILAGGFAGGGVFLGLQANKYRDDLRAEIDAGNPPPDSRDPRYTKGKVFAIAADAAFAIAGVTALTAVYYTLRDKGAPSTGLIDVRAMALVPQIGPQYAGLGMEVSW